VPQSAASSSTDAHIVAVATQASRSLARSSLAPEREEIGHCLTGVLESESALITGTEA